jgi:hypothetical protein
MNTPGGGLRVIAWGVALILLPWGEAQAGDLQKVLETVIQGNRAVARSQSKVDKLSGQTGDLLSEYRSVLQQIDSVRAYNAQVEKLVQAQREEVAALENKIENATMIGREVTPLMLRMIEALESFVELDVPFLLEERRNRVAGLRELMDRADVADSEKFRRILEAYQVENDFGRTIEAYKGNLTLDGEERTVNFLRIGRIALLYLTLNDKEVGFWNKAEKKWQKLPLEYRSSVKKGLRIAQKQIAPDLIRLPVFAPGGTP